MNIILDIILACIVIICAVKGYKQGFVLTLSNFLPYILSLFLTNV